MTLAGEMLLLMVAAPLFVLLGIDSLRSWWQRRRGEAREIPLGGDDGYRNGNGRHRNGNGRHRNGNSRGNGNGTDRLWRRLRAAGFDLSPVAFLIAVVVLGALAFLAVLELLPPSLLTTAAAALVGLVAMYAAYSLVRDMAVHRARKFEVELVDAIDLMVGALEGGENPTHALATAGDAAREPVRGEFLRAVDRLRLGAPIDGALDRMLTVYDSEGVRLFAHTLIAKWHVGGDLAPVLRSVNKIIREQVKMRLHLQGQLAGARFASLAVAGIPYLLVPAYIYVQPHWWDILTTHPLGPFFLFLGVCLQVIGFLWIRKLMRLEL